MTSNYQPLKGLSMPAVIGLAIMIFLNFFIIISAFIQIFSPTWTLNLRGLNYPAGFFLINIIAAVKLLIYIFTIIFFLIWLNRANKNLSALGVENQEFSSGWAVGWWFVPIAYLFKPYQVVREIWNESEPDAASEYGFLSGSMSAPGFMKVWWFCWIGSLIVNYFSSLAANKDSLEPIVSIFAVASLLSIIAGSLAIKIVIGITERQKERFEKMAVSPGNIYNQPPQPPTFN